ncbi:uncharacterized protein C8Q71DRAFT_238639 [Rhodofomes roseus]|uniref:F-box domain-containing protein n=1 Tax=Rhodofomes roseus TaxID=34475 RepID=A0ABQ8KWH3_9APHY|nr:uncharacterized protein C8Q71DRAFT_238639 [Rhodofomes roseus]KAH9843181.1 hypothetical protein C8Q71DRAFT_238639 [Rhodofomes roseus]
MSSSGPQPSLPVELWLHIFRLSTLSPLTTRLYVVSYSPFQTIPLEAEDESVTKKTKSALVQVCKQWRAWALDLLFEDVWIECPEKMSSLLGDGSGCGRWVRRASLPYMSSATVSPRPLEANKMLEQCPHLEVLVRKGPTRRDVDTRFEFAAECPAMPSLKRVDWWHVNEAARSGGINLLGDVLQKAPNVQYLSLGGYVRFSSLSVNGTAITLSSLTTLRFLRLNAALVRQTCGWSMPALQHIIIDTVEDVAVLSMFWESFGEQIRTIELGHYLSYFVHDWLSFILRGCPHITELNYYIHFTAIPTFDDEKDTFPLLTTVGLHAQPNMMISPESSGYWGRMQSHFAMLCCPCFPAVKKVLLYGDWSGISSDIRYPFLVQPLLDRRITIERVET